MPFAQEVYAKHSDEMKALHPKGFSNKNFVQLNGLPKAKEWKSIFHMFPFQNLLEYAMYFAKIFAYLSEKQKETLMIAYGLQPNVAKERELFQLATLSTPLKRLFMEKNIPPRLLSLLKPLDYNIIEKLAEILSGTYLKNNVAKEIVELFVDLTLNMQQIFLQKAHQAKQNASKDGLIFLNERFRTDSLRITFSY